MNAGNLDTTNLLLGIMAAVSVLDALMTRVDTILADVKDVTARVTNRAERVDAAIRHTMGRVDGTAGRVRSSVSSRVNRVLTLVHTARAAVDGFLNHSRRAEQA